MTQTDCALLLSVAKLHEAETTAAVMTALEDTLRGFALAQSFTVLLNFDPKQHVANVCYSNAVVAAAGDLVSLTTVETSQSLQAPVVLFEPAVVDIANTGVLTYYVAPLQREGVAYGLLLLHAPIDEPALVPCGAVVSQLAIALYNAQLAEYLRFCHAADVAKLSAIGTLAPILSGLEFDTVLAKLMEVAISTSGADVGCIALRSEREAYLDIAIEWGIGKEVLDALRERDGQSLPAAVVEREQSLFVAKHQLAEALHADPALDAIDNLMMLPIRGQSGAIGCIVLLNLSCTQEKDLETLELVARLSSNAVENALLHRERIAEEALKEQLRIAGAIQQELLPKCSPELDGAKIAALSVSCDESGGDYYDFFPVDEHRFGFAVGDATGHGIGAAMIATTARACLRALLRPVIEGVPEFSSILAHLNELLVADFPEDKFITLFIGLFDTRTGVLTYASAGHDPPLMVFRQGTGAVEYLESTGIPLGMFTGAVHELGRPMPLDPGDVFVLMTDGVHEAPAPTGEQYGKARVLDVVRAKVQESPEIILDHLWQDLKAFRGDCAQCDDITALCLQFDGLYPGTHALAQSRHR